VRAVNGGYNAGPPGQGSFPVTVERVGRAKGNLIPRRSEHARKETGMGRGEPRREDIYLAQTAGSGCGESEPEIHRGERAGRVS